MGLVEGVTDVDSPVVTWDEKDGEVSNVVFDRDPAADNVAGAAASA